MSVDVVRVALGEKLVVTNVTAFYQEFKTQLQAKSYQIDASKITEIDGAGIQLIYYTFNHILKNQYEVQWHPEPSVYFVQQAHLMGIEKMLLKS